MIVMPSKEKVRAEVEILPPAMARDISWVHYSEASPQFVIFAPRIYFLNNETGHRKMEWRRQVCPQSIAVEVGSIESIPRSIDRLTLCVLRRIEPFIDNGPVQSLDSDPVRRKVGSLVICAIRDHRGRFALGRHSHAVRRWILGHALHPK
jgi:hypothetical protein